jgi:hypothetical protein
MFPFKTKEFELHVLLTTDQLKNRLEKSVHKWRLISIDRDGEVYGTIKGNKVKFELGQCIQRNSFRPTVVFSWKDEGSKIRIRGFYRVALSVLISSSVFPLAGIVIAFQASDILPFLCTLLLWSFMYMTLGLYLFKKDFKWVEQELYKLIGYRDKVTTYST